MGELARLAVTSGWGGIKRGAASPFGNIWRIGRRAMARWRRRMNRMTSMRREEEWIERCESKESVNLMVLVPPPTLYYHYY